MAEQRFYVGAQMRVKNKLYTVGSEITCDPKDLVGAEHCVQPMAEIESKQEAKAKAEAKAAAEEKAKAKAAGK